MPARLPIVLLALLALPACQGQDEPRFPDQSPPAGSRTATVGGGCFWCVEAVFQRLDGVSKVVSGYAGGTVENPTYAEVSNGSTGHAEVCQITFDPSVVGYDEILEVFFATHDPTTVDRQGNDRGPQYRSIILYADDDERRTAERVRDEIERSGAHDDPIVTEIVPLTVFYPAEDYHQDYFERNRDQPYCAFVVAPKVKKFRQRFEDRAKER